MTIITQDQALQRWDTLPSSLREALCSEVNTDFLLKTCADENIAEPKTYEVSRIAGYVLLGFLHPEDVAQELVEAIKIDSKTAKLVQDALNGRIFIPLRADIDKIYAPLSKHAMSSALTASPKIIQDVNTTIPTPIQKPVTLSDIGWSKMPAAASPTPAIQPVPMTSVSPRPVTIPVPTPATQAKPAEPAPMMLHEDTTFKPAEKNEGFTLPKPGAGAEMHIGAGVPQAPIRPAVLEFGGAKMSVPPPPKPTVGASYHSEFKPLLSSTPITTDGLRNVSQIVLTASTPIPKPPIPPVTPAIPTNTVPVPPRPPQAVTPMSQPPAPPQNSKPIVKDFL